MEMFKSSPLPSKPPISTMDLIWKKDLSTADKNVSTVFCSPLAEPLVRQVMKTRINRDDFHILKVIGRGTFSEVSAILGQLSQNLSVMFYLSIYLSIYFYRGEKSDLGK